MSTPARALKGDRSVEDEGAGAGRLIHTSRHVGASRGALEPAGPAGDGHRGGEGEPAGFIGRIVEPIVPGEDLIAIVCSEGRGAGGAARHQIYRLFEVHGALAEEVRLARALYRCRGFDRLAVRTELRGNELERGVVAAGEGGVFGLEWAVVAADGEEKQEAECQDAGHGGSGFGGNWGGGDPASGACRADSRRRSQARSPCGAGWGARR